MLQKEIIVIFSHENREWSARRHKRKEEESTTVKTTENFTKRQKQQTSLKQPIFISNRKKQTKAIVITAITEAFQF